MRWRVLLTSSLLANIVLAAGLILAVRHRHFANANAEAGSEEAGSPLIKTNVVLRRQFLSWSHVESPDYTTYISNLRDIGCPEQTIRDIIIADVDALFARRRATEIVTPAQEWWRSEPSPEVVKLAEDKSVALELERRALLTKLLGPDWEGGDLVNLPRPSKPGVALDGPFLGSLSTETKQAVEDISARAADRVNQYLKDMRDAGKTPDPAELARMRQQTRTELAGVLSPDQLEEYLLRYSQTANDLRAQFAKLKYFNASPDEFRAIFRAEDPIDQQIQLLGDATDPMTVAQRNSLIQQENAALKLALGADRYRTYQALHDPLYQQAMASAIKAGDPSSVDSIYAINLVAQRDSNQITANTNLTDSQKAIELKTLELQQLTASTAASGQALPPEPPPPPPPAPPTASHVMGQTETASGLAKLYNVPMSQLQALNPGVDLDRIMPGQTIQIPQFSPPHMTVPP